MEGTLRNYGFEVVSLGEAPDICIVNTCTVTSKSDYQSRQLIRRAHKAGAKVVVTGCYSELNKDSVKKMEGVVKVVANKEKYNYINEITGKNGGFALNFSSSRTRLTLKVQDGCDSSCSYCIIPKARGSSRSAAPEGIVSEVKRAVEAGKKEVVLTGIHLGAYGHDLRPEMTLSGLVEGILDKTGVQRLRLSSIEATEIDERLLGLFKNERLCRHLHIPLQSGDDNILKSMNRSYNAGYFADKIMSISRLYPGISIGTDVIAGFPGEGEAEFRNTCNLIERLPFSYIHVFPFSPRPETKAAEMPGSVKDSEKTKRSALLRALSERKKTGYMLGHIGKTLDVLMEERLPDGSCSGTSSNYLKIKVISKEKLRGTIVRVRVQGMDNGLLLGKPEN